MVAVIRREKVVRIAIAVDCKRGGKIKRRHRSLSDLRRIEIASSAF
jgi:hypothetical protein